MTRISASILFLLTGCLETSSKDDEASNDTASSATTDDTGAEVTETDTETETTTGTETSTETETTTTSAWSFNSNNCGSGSKFDALWFDDKDNGFHGCGQNGSGGQGLWQTTDGGASWSPVETQEAGTFFDSMRVNHLWRSPFDNRLYVSGERSGGFRVLSLDSSNSLGEVYKNYSNVDYSMTVGSYAHTSQGTEVAESLTGSGVIIRQSSQAWLQSWPDYEGWVSAYGWWNESGNNGGLQILDMAVVNDQIIGVGSTIANTPKVYLPPKQGAFGSDVDGDRTYAEKMWDVVELSESFGQYKGECWNVAGNADGIAIGCVNQDAGKGMVYTIGQNWLNTGYDTAGWTSLDVSTVLEGGDDPSWTHGVCRGPNNLVVAVGYYSMQEEGWLIMSKDGGNTWTDRTSELTDAFGNRIPSLYRCQVIDNHVFAAGPGATFTLNLADDQ